MTYDLDPLTGDPMPKGVAAFSSQSRSDTLALTDDELRTMAKEKLSALLQSIDAKKSPSLLLSVAREVLDRLEGKPTQRIEQKVEHSSKSNANEMTNEQLMLALLKAQEAGLLPGGMKMLGGDIVVDAEYSVSPES